MKRISLFAAAGGAALLLAAPASTHNGPTLIIRHQTRGCHAWAFAPTGAYKASQSVTLRKGEDLTIGNNDVMPHRIVQLSGPALKLGKTANLNSVGKSFEISFQRAGVYRLTTKAGEDYMKGMKTVGEDNVLTLKVTVR